MSKSCSSEQSCISGHGMRALIFLARHYKTLTKCCPALQQPFTSLCALGTVVPCLTCLVQQLSFLLYLFSTLSVSFNLCFSEFLPFSAIFRTHLTWHLLSAMRIKPTLWFRWFVIGLQHYPGTVTLQQGFSKWALGTHGGHKGVQGVSKKFERKTKILSNRVLGLQELTHAV